MIRTHKYIRPSVLCMIFMLSTASWGHSLWIYTKACVAQILIEQAWQHSLNNGENKTPWPWADTWPIARLKVESTNRDFYVLAGGQGNSLAFGPGHLNGTALPGEQGTIVLSGHRDTHFKFLEHQAIHDTFALQDKNGKWQYYTIVQQLIHDTDQGPWVIENELDQLHLVTCYPFNSPIPGGSLRHITIAQKLDPAQVADNDSKSPHGMHF